MSVLCGHDGGRSKQDKTFKWLKRFNKRSRAGRTDRHTAANQLRVLDDITR